MSELNSRIDSLSPAKRALLEQRLKAAQQSEQKSISPRPARAEGVLSSSQQRLCFLDQMTPGSTVYNRPTHFRLSGSLNMQALHESLNAIVARHDVLRMTFRQVAGEFVGAIAPKLLVDLPIIDLSNQHDAEQTTQVEQIATVAGEQAFDLAAGPLIRAQLIKLGEQSHLLLVNIHHIVFDGWSANIFQRELAEIYGAIALNQPLALPPLPIQYDDFAHWQNQWQQSDRYQQQLTYWQQHLADASPVLNLPIDYPRPALQTFDGEVHVQKLSPSLKEQLLNLGNAEGTTLFMTMLSAFKLLCYRLTNQEKITVGSPIAGRTHADIEPLIGFFVSNLVLHTDLSGVLTCQDLLQQVKQTALEAYANQAVPFESLLEALQPPRDLSRTPLFQVWFNMVNIEESVSTPTGLETQPLTINNKVSAKFDLTLYIHESTDGLFVRWVYNTRLFKPETIEYISDCFQAVLEGMVAQPKQKISTLPLPLPNTQKPLTGAAITHPFTEFKKSEIEQSIAARFETIVRHHGNRAAVKTADHSWTYQMLNEQADRIARGLIRSQNTTVEQVALLFESGAPMVAAILGVLKAGKAYVALDATYPTDRLRYILSDSHAATIVVDSQTIAMARSLIAPSTAIINIDELTVDNSVPLPSISPSSLAYILYTSGSTGKPKGVMQNHRNVLHFIQTYTNSLHISPQDRLTLLSSYSFDGALMDIFGALLNGATLYPFNIKRDGLDELTQRLIQEKITIYHSTSTLYRYFLEAARLNEIKDFSHIRLVVLGGETTIKSDVDLYKQYFSKDAIFVNGFGSSESSVTLQQFISHHMPIDLDNVAVGYPVEDTEVILLNEAGEETQLYGEIAIRSEHVALGYWRKDELTQQVFLSEPSAHVPQQRTYKTGDLGRLRSDGAIEYLGRKDFQVKLRGFRIELGEIEAVLTAHPQVKKAVVVAQNVQVNEASRKNGTAKAPMQKLVAYLEVAQPAREVAQPANDKFEQHANTFTNMPMDVSADASSDVSINTSVDDKMLRRFVSQFLPDYMTPAAFVCLDALPLTPSGKVSRRMLLELAGSALSLSRATTERVLPRTPVEQQLAAVWCDLLQLKEVGIYDNFFELGGHSLLATQVVSQVSETLSVALPLRTLFELPTIASLVPALEQLSMQSSNQQPMTPIARRDRQKRKRSSLT